MAGVGVHGRHARVHQELAVDHHVNSAHAGEPPFHSFEFGASRLGVVVDSGDGCSVQAAGVIASKVRIAQLACAANSYRGLGTNQGSVGQARSHARLF